MYTGDVWGITLLLAGAVATLASIQLLILTLFTRRVERAAAALAARPVACPGLGLLLLVPVVLLTAVAAQAGKGVGPALAGLLALIQAIVWPMALAVGSRAVGARLPSQGAAAEPWRQTLRGAITLGIASLFPLVGWLLILPLWIASGIGALALSRKVEPAHTAPPAEAAT